MHRNIIIQYTCNEQKCIKKKSTFSENQERKVVEDSSHISVRKICHSVKMRVITQH